MTHLRIELNNIQENVSSDVITKLYQLAISGTLDNSSNLQGNIHTTTTYLKYITDIMLRYPDLYISSDVYYMYFEDPVISNIFANCYYGDGTGILTDTYTNLSAFNFLYYNIDKNIFDNRSTITSFNELAQNTNITSFNRSLFYGAGNLTSVDISNITNLIYECFTNCSSLVSLSNLNNLPNLIYVGNKCFRNCTSLTEITMPNYTGKADAGYTSGAADVFYGCSNLVKVNAPNMEYIGDNFFANCTSLTNVSTFKKVKKIGGAAFWKCPMTTLYFRDLQDAATYLVFGQSLIQKVIIDNTTPPNVDSNLTFRDIPSGIAFYVPDSAVSDYKLDSGWSAVQSLIHPISDLSADEISIINQQ